MSGKQRLILRFSGLAVFLAVLFGASFWLVRSYLTQPIQAAVVKNLKSSILQPGAPTVAPAHPEAKVPLLQGTVVDAQTHQPIPRFYVTFGMRRSVQQYMDLPSYTTRLFRNGKYSRKLPGYGSIDVYSLRVEADGHYAAVLSLKEPGTQNFALEPKRDLDGRVLSPDGTPADGAFVMVAAPALEVDFQNGQPADGQVSVQTSSDGRFHIPPQRGAFAVGVASEQGYARVDQDEFAKSTDIRLTPWSRLEGTLTQHAYQPMDGDQNMNTEPSVNFSFSGMTDEHGHFKFDRVPAGDVRLFYSHREPTRQGDAYFMESRQLASVTLGVGQTLRFPATPLSRSISGRLLLPAHVPAGVSPRISGQIDGVVIVEPPDGAAYHPAQANLHYYAVQVGADGSFTVDDVLPDMYQLTILYDWRNGRSPLMGFAQFVVPAGDSQQIVKLPDVPLVELGKEPAVGQPMLPISTQTLDGRDMSLSDYRGKYLLIAFSGTRIDSPRLVALKAIYAKLAGDKRFAMIGLTYSWRRSEMIQFAQENNIPWATGLLAPQMELSGIRVRSAWLIGPDGKVVARDLGLFEINTAITKALQK